MAYRLAHFVPVKLPAKPPEDGQRQKAKRPKLNVFSRNWLQELVNRLTRQETKPQDIGSGEGYYSS